jgi:hypothetical protein
MMMPDYLKHSYKTTAGDALRPGRLTGNILASDRCCFEEDNT